MQGKFLSAFALFAIAAIGLSAQTALKGVVGLSLPPYIVQASDNGMELDIVRQALKSEGYSLTISYVPFARIPVSLQDKTADCAFPTNESSGLTSVYYSDIDIIYQNVAVSLKAKNLKIKTIGDLGQYSVLAFGDAPAYLGSEFAAMAKTNTRYSEIADQENQVRLLFLGRADVIVMDVNIFKYFRQKMGDAGAADVSIAELFPPTDYKVAFNDKSVCDKFNLGLKQLRASGAYADIIKKYIK